MSHRFAKMLFPKLVLELDRLRQKNKELSVEHAEMESQYEVLQNSLKGIYKALQKFQLLAIEQVNNGELAMVLRHDISPSDLQILVYDLDFLEPFAFMELTYDRELRIIHINRMETSESNQSYGSLAMKGLFKIAESLWIRKIEGEITPVDGDHLDRLKSFYEKHQFHVRLSNEKKYAKIVWKRAQS
ncbi:hypothetical protein [Collibacillus ludicampi]|uniref:hypothetical protein n=1 Tax=Collibacillus ludicampi TaxID=2771369 RepID=UPI0024959B18|nr:hypothetical protein [Collibacillus ludicampi]